MSRICPACGNRWGFWENRCACEHDVIDNVIHLASAFNWIDPAIDLAKDLKNVGKVTRYVNGVKTDEEPDYD